MQSTCLKNGAGTFNNSLIHSTYRCTNMCACNEVEQHSPSRRHRECASQGWGLMLATELQAKTNAVNFLCITATVRR